MKTRADVEQVLLSNTPTDDEFCALLLADPHKSLSDATGIETPAGIDLTVHEEDSASFHLLLVKAGIGSRDVGVATGGLITAKCEKVIRLGFSAAHLSC